MLLNRPVIAYLNGGALRGGLQTLHPRVLDELNDAAGNVTLHDVKFVSNHGDAHAAAQLQSQQVLLSKRHMLLVADLVPTGPSSAEIQVPRERYDVTLAVGPYWVSGSLHLPIGIEPFGYLDGSGVGFTALTGAHLVKLDDEQRHTVLINREMVSCLMIRHTT